MGERECNTTQLGYTKEKNIYKHIKKPKCQNTDSDQNKLAYKKVSEFSVLFWLGVSPVSKSSSPLKGSLVGYLTLELCHFTIFCSFSSVRGKGENLDI
jgi:hypothetical protein